jgi:hypothetical protein
VENGDSDWPSEHFNRIATRVEAVRARCWLRESGSTQRFSTSTKEKGFMSRIRGSSMRRFRRVREFLTAHPEWNTSPSFARNVTELDEVLQEMSQLTQEQDAARRFGRGDTERQRALRETLWNEHMLPVAGMAREAFGIPGVASELRMPAKSADNDRLLAVARAMADAAEKQKEIFTNLGLREDFVERLRESAQALADALVARVENHRRLVESTKQLHKLAVRGRRAIRVINLVIKPQLSGNEKLLAAWESAKAPSDPGAGRSSAPEVPQPDITKAA